MGKEEVEGEVVIDYALCLGSTASVGGARQSGKAWSNLHFPDAATPESFLLFKVRSCE
jgi:hypothetical protein